MPKSFMPVVPTAAEQDVTVTQAPADPRTSVRTGTAGTWGYSYLAPAGYLGTRAEIEKELDAIVASIRGFADQMPDQVMRACAAYSARLTELCVLLHRVETQDRQYTRIRTQQVERFLAEIDRQFKIASRLVEVQRQDLDLLRG